MPVEFLSDEQAAAYGVFTGDPSATDVERFFYLDDADRSLVARRRSDSRRIEQREATRPAATIAPAGDAAVTAAVSPRDAQRIVVGTKNFPEHFLLGELYAQALRAKGFDVTLKHNLGATKVLNKALDRGELGMYPEYTGMICTQLAKLGNRPRSAQAAYEAAQEWQDAHGNAMLEPSAFHTRGCIVVRTAFAHEHELTTVGDLSRLGHFTYGGTPELATCSRGAEGLRQTYGLHNFTFQPLVFGLQYAELDEHKVDAIACLATEGQLASDDYRVLTDPKDFFGFDQVAPVMKKPLLAMMPPVFVTTLNEVTGLLSPEVMIALNKATQLDKKDPSTVARTFLNDNGLLT